MRELKLNGYIDEEQWWPDDITPDVVRNMLYGEKDDLADDVHITLNSYGGSVNAATMIHDIIRAYPGQVHITVSGTAASAAVGMSMAADVLDMTPGSMMMIHDPSMVAWGNVRDMQSAIQMLNAAKESILNIYEGRCKTERDEIGRMMTDETWMDSKTALQHGFIDAIRENGGAKNSAGEPMFNRAEAEKKVKAFCRRRMADKMSEQKPKARAEPEKNSARERRIRLTMMQSKKG